MHRAICGDNLAILPTLTERFDLAYLDPPYGTGESRLPYEDRHTDWVGWMHPRLVAAREVMKPNGLLLASVDDRQQHRMRALLDEVFGEDAFLTTFVWLQEGATGNHQRIRSSHEYVHAYVNGDPRKVWLPTMIDAATPPRSPLHRDLVRNAATKQGDRNRPSLLHIPAGFPCAIESGTVPRSHDRMPHWSGSIEVEGHRLVRSLDVRSGWANRRILQAFIDSGFTPVEDRRGILTRFEINSRGNIDYLRDRAEPPTSLTTILRGMGTVRDACEGLRALGVDFVYPKPLRLMEHLLALAPSCATILDPFGGSGTTIVAAGNLNQRDGGSRRVTLITNAESYETVTVPRLRASGASVQFS